MRCCCCCRSQLLATSCLPLVGWPWREQAVPLAGAASGACSLWLEPFSQVVLPMKLPSEPERKRNQPPTPKRKGTSSLRLVLFSIPTPFTFTSPSSLQGSFYQRVKRLRILFLLRNHFFPLHPLRGLASPSAIPKHHIYSTDPSTQTSRWLPTLIPTTPSTRRRST